jgi:hypothetical protein
MATGGFDVHGDVVDLGRGGHGHWFDLRLASDSDDLSTDVSGRA